MIINNELSDRMIRQLNILFQKRKGMEALDILKLALRAMYACNNTHCHEIFIDPEIDHQEEALTFDITASNLVHAYQLQELFNMTVHMEPAGDKIKYALLP